MTRYTDAQAREATRRILDGPPDDRVPDFEEFFSGAGRRDQEDAREAVKSLARSVDKLAVRKILKQFLEGHLIELYSYRSPATRARARKSRRVIAAAIKALGALGAIHGDIVPPEAEQVRAQLMLRSGYGGSKSKGGCWPMSLYQRPVKSLMAIKVGRAHATALLRAIITLPGPRS